MDESPQMRAWNAWFKKAQAKAAKNQDSQRVESERIDSTGVEAIEKDSGIIPRSPLAGLSSEEVERAFDRGDYEPE